jgi:hypothetical protein
MKITLSNGSVVEGTNDELAQMIETLCQSPKTKTVKVKQKRRFAKQKLDPNHKDKVINYLIEHVDELKDKKPKQISRKLNSINLFTAYGHKWTGQAVSGFMSKNNIKL